VAETTVKMPKLGLTMEEGDVVEWHVAVGTDVAIEDDLVTIGTDKAETVFESPYAGRVIEILQEAGATCAVGEPLCVIES
jgi:pyruvate/2-oxoglutarate dehydrogenase complex dihydrolipoamide acyltransferase (E2) component